MKILVTGPRIWTDVDWAEETLLRAVDSAPVPEPPEVPEPIIVINGGAEGLDKIIDRITRNHGWQPCVMPANWKTHGYKGGGIRNEAMASMGIDLALVFLMRCPKTGCTYRGKPRPEGHWTHGTDDCYRRIKRHDIPHWKIYGDEDV